MTEVMSGIYQLKLPLPAQHFSLGYVNTYLFRGDNGYLLVDTGWNTSEAFDSLQKQLAEINVDFNDITRIVLTHIHPDHYGLSGRLRQISPARFFLHHLDAKLIKSRYTNMDKLLHKVNQWLQINGVPQDELPELRTASVKMSQFVATVSPDVSLRGGETIDNGIFSFRVLWTPGHSPGHICLYEPNRKILVSGDHVLPTITPNVGLHPQSSENPLEEHLNSLNSLKQLSVDFVLPGHGDPFTDLAARIDETNQHHEERNLEILKSLKPGPKTAYQITSEIKWQPDTGNTGWQSLPPLHKRLAILEILAHLKAMVIDGRADKALNNGIIFYRQT